MKVTELQQKFTSQQEIKTAQVDALAVKKPVVTTPVFKFNKDGARIKNIHTKEDVTKYTGYSEDFIDGLIRKEQFRLETYKDIAGQKTIGIGHNINADRNYFFGGTITEEEAYQLLAKDLLNTKKEVKTLLKGKTVTNSQMEALSDLVFNVGAKKISESKLIKYIKNNEFDKAANEFNYIHYGKGIVSVSLCERRIENINDFYKNQHTPKSVKAMENIFKKGDAKYSKLIENAGFFKRPVLIWKQANYEKKVSQIIQNAKIEAAQNK